MKLNRRNVLIGLGGIAAGAGTLAGTGAFTSVTATRDAVVNVAGDAGALLSIRAADSPNGNAYVSTNSNGEVGLDLSTESGSGVNPNAVTQIDEVLRVMNQGTQPVGFYVEDTDGNGSNSDVVTFEANGDTVEGSDNAVVLEVGESLVLDIEVDTEGESDLSDTQVLSEVTFYADYAEAGTAPGQDGVHYVSKTAQNADFVTISNAVSTAAPGDTVLVDEGTYEEKVLVDTDQITFRAESSESPPTLVGGFGFGPTTRGHTVTGFTIDNTDPANAVDEPASLGGPAAFHSGGAAINVGHADDVVITNNTILGAGKNDSPAGLSFDFDTSSGPGYPLPTGGIVANNTFVDLYTGSWTGGDQLTFEENTFENCGAAFGGTEGGSVEITRNIFDGCGIEDVFGAVDVGAGDVTVSLNDFLSNCANAVNNFGSEPLDARNNFYGDASGPSSDPVITDSDSSVQADGDGVSIGDVGNGDINFAPFREQPVFSKTVTVDAEGQNLTSIQGGIDAARPGDTVEVVAGTYSESVTIDKPLQLLGESGVVIDGSSLSGNGLTIAADGSSSKSVLVEGLTVTNWSGDGIRLAGDYVTLRDVTSTNANSGLDVSGGTSVTNLLVEDSSFDNNTFGWYIANPNSGSSGVFDNITVRNTTFNENAKKGLYAEKLSNALFDDISVVESGVAADYKFNNGIDINLKYGQYSDITIKNSTFDSSGVPGSNVSDADKIFFSSALTVKGRDDGTYAATPPTTVDNVVIENNDFSFDSATQTATTTTAISLGEYQADNDTPGQGEEATVSNNSYTNVDTQIDDQTV